MDELFTGNTSISSLVVIIAKTMFVCSLKEKLMWVLCVLRKKFLAP